MTRGNNATAAASGAETRNLLRAIAKATGGDNITNNVTIQAASTRRQLVTMVDLTKIKRRQIADRAPGSLGLLAAVQLRRPEQLYALFVENAADPSGRDPGSSGGRGQKNSSASYGYATGLEYGEEARR